MCCPLFVSPTNGAYFMENLTYIFSVQLCEISTRKPGYFVLKIVNYVVYVMMKKPFPDLINVIFVRLVIKHFGGNIRIYYELKALWMCSCNIDGLRKYSRYKSKVQ